MQIADRVWFRKPLYPVLKRQGFTLVDMHIHTRYSDGLAPARLLMKKAMKLGIGMAVTDHNDIRAAVELARENIMLVPGIEVNTNTRKDILLYFYDINELKEFYERHIAAYRTTWPKLRVCKTVSEILEDAEEYNCLKSIPHPYGYLYKNIIKTLEQKNEIMKAVDAIEVMNGGQTRKRNHKSIALTQRHEKGFTAGTDCHSVSEFGKVVTFSYADNVEAFLDSIKKKQNFVMGRESSKIKCTIETSIIQGKKAGAPIGRVGRHTRETIRNGIGNIRPRVGNIRSRMGSLRSRIKLGRRGKF